jgi:hypothetical protein
MKPSTIVFARKCEDGLFWVGYYGTEAWTLSCHIKRLSRRDAIEDAQSMLNDLYRQIEKEQDYPPKNPL